MITHNRMKSCRCKSSPPIVYLSIKLHMSLLLFPFLAVLIGLKSLMIAVDYKLNNLDKHLSHFRNLIAQNLSFRSHFDINRRLTHYQVPPISVLCQEIVFGIIIAENHTYRINDQTAYSVHRPESAQGVRNNMHRE